MTNQITKAIVVLRACGLLFLTTCSIKGGGPMQSNAYEAIHSKIAGLTVNDLEDHAVAVDGLWQDRRVVLVFLRHYG